MSIGGIGGDAGILGPSGDDEAEEASAPAASPAPPGGLAGGAPPRPDATAAPARFSLSSLLVGAPEHIDLTQDIAASPSEVWPYLTDPTKMNEWSEAKVSLLAPGADGTAASVGARRQIQIKELGVPVATFQERIEASDPPHSLTYHVTGGLPTKAHEGTITLEPIAGGGTRVHWTVDYQFNAPLFGTVAKWLLDSQLKSSLSSLAGLFGR